MRLGDTMPIYCPRCQRVTHSRSEVCDVDLGGQLVIDRILCAVCRRCGKITALAARDALRVGESTPLSPAEREAMDEVLALVRRPPAPAVGALPAAGPQADLQACCGFPERPGGTTRQAPRFRPGQIFYAGLGLGTLLAGLALLQPEHALPSFVSFATATVLYSILLGRCKGG